MPVRLQRTICVAVTAAIAALSAGCSSDNTLSTAAVAPVSTAPAAKVDPACVSLAAQIDSLRQEGTPERIEKASTGKSTTVPVKRASLAKQAELNRANAEFQLKCSTITPRPQTAAAPAPAAPVAAASSAAAPAVASAAKVAPAVATTGATTGAAKDVAQKAATDAAKDAAKDAATSSAKAAVAP